MNEHDLVYPLIREMNRRADFLDRQFEEKGATAEEYGEHGFCVYLAFELSRISRGADKGEFIPAWREAFLQRLYKGEGKENRARKEWNRQGVILAKKLEEIWRNADAEKLS